MAMAVRTGAGVGMDTPVRKKQENSGDISSPDSVLQFNSFEPAEKSAAISDRLFERQHVNSLDEEDYKDLEMLRLHLQLQNVGKDYDLITPATDDEIESSIECLMKWRSSIGSTFEATSFGSTFEAPSGSTFEATSFGSSFETTFAPCFACVCSHSTSTKTATEPRPSDNDWKGPLGALHFGNTDASSAIVGILMEKCDACLDDMVFSGCFVFKGGRKTEHKPISRARAHGRPPDGGHYQGFHGRPPDLVRAFNNSAFAHEETSDGTSVRTYSILYHSSVLGSLPASAPLAAAPRLRDSQPDEFLSVKSNSSLCSYQGSTTTPIA